MSYDCDIFPDNLKAARLKHFPNKGSKVVVTLLISSGSDISEVTESITNLNILKNLETNKLIHNREYGFP